MRKLANHKNKHFWWEDIYKFEKENLEVRREYHNYDLSIYIQVNTKWVPVLILENKVKSLPYAEQLAQYTDKANKEWNKKSRKDSCCQTCDDQNYISFILLSLTDAENLQIDEIQDTWSFKNYNDLAAALKKYIDSLTDYHQQVCRDYYNFIMELSKLAKSWNLDHDNSYLTQLCPAVIKAEISEDAYSNYENLCIMRLNDIWQKINFDRLCIKLNEKLSSKDIHCIRYPKNKKGLKSGFYLDTGYTRDTGLIELRYVIKSNPKDDEPTSVLIQLQGKQYRYAATKPGIVNSKNGNPTPKEENNQIHWINAQPGIDKTRWHHFCNSFIYRYRIIKVSETIDNILDQIVIDAIEISRIFKA